MGVSRSEADVSKMGRDKTRGGTRQRSSQRQQQPQHLFRPCRQRGHRSTTPTQVSTPQTATPVRCQGTPCRIVQRLPSPQPHSQHPRPHLTQRLAQVCFLPTMPLISKNFSAASMAARPSYPRPKSRRHNSATLTKRALTPSLILAIMTRGTGRPLRGLPRLSPNAEWRRNGVPVSSTAIQRDQQHGISD
jgi:hypothetical protein